MSDYVVSPVAGGFHAQDPVLKVVAFGRTEEEALRKLGYEQQRAKRLDALRDERRIEQQAS